MGLNFEHVFMGVSLTLVLFIGQSPVFVGDHTTSVDLSMRSDAQALAMPALLFRGTHRFITKVSIRIMDRYKALAATYSIFYLPYLIPWAIEIWQAMRDLSDDSAPRRVRLKTEVVLIFHSGMPRDIPNIIKSLLPSA